MVIRNRRAFHSWRRREMAEACGWLFVDFIPLLFEKRNVARQLKVETWLDLSQLVKELGIEKLEETKRNAPLRMSYIV